MLLISNSIKNFLQSIFNVSFKSCSDICNYVTVSYSICKIFKLSHSTDSYGKSSIKLLK